LDVNETMEDVQLMHLGSWCDICSLGDIYEKEKEKENLLVESNSDSGSELVFGVR